ncbi:MAG: GNAT family N-acetyltransferase [Myxococcota bacterium]|nr:GNAT family N-acetyltransferase [Myxococcota bacterium]
MDQEITPWRGDIESANRVFDLVEEALPVTQKADRSRADEILKLRQKNFHEGTFLVWIDSQVQGFVMLSKTGSPDVIDVTGIVRANYHRRGIGTALLAKAIAVLKDRSISGKLRSVAFDSNPSGHHFLEHHGFKAVDKQVWSELSTQSTYPSWAGHKLRKIESGSIQFLGGHQLRTIRDDWLHAWWRLVTSTAADIPSRVTGPNVSFDDWKKWMESPSVDQSHTVFALDGAEPIAVLSLGRLTDGKVNIHYTGVHTSYRRRGLSTALKFKALRLARKLGAHTLVTQNHQDNPMLDLNRRLGFTEVNSMTEYVRQLDANNQEPMRFGGV